MHTVIVAAHLSAVRFGHVLHRDIRRLLPFTHIVMRLSIMPTRGCTAKFFLPPYKVPHFSKAMLMSFWI